MGPVQAENAKVNVLEDNSTSFLNVHLPSLSYIGLLIIIIFSLVAAWKWIASKRKRSDLKERIRQLELRSISSTLDHVGQSGVADFSSSSLSTTTPTATTTTSPSNTRGFKHLDAPSF